MRHIRDKRDVRDITDIRDIRDKKRHEADMLFLKRGPKSGPIS